MPEYTVRSKTDPPVILFPLLSIAFDRKQGDPLISLGRFSILCEEDSHLLELVRHIHLNCIRGLMRGIEELDRHSAVGKAFGVTGGEVIRGSRRQAVSLARPAACYLGSRDPGKTERELPRSLASRLPRFIIQFLRGGKVLWLRIKVWETKLGKYLAYLTTSPRLRPLDSVSSLLLIPWRIRSGPATTE